MTDPLDRVLFVDLTRRVFHVEERPELFARTLGGAGAAIDLLQEICPPGCDPLAPGNPIVFAVGPLTGLFPMASKTVAMFKSPHTGNLGESHCGGRSASAIRMAGYGAMVITGASDLPVYLVIQGDRVRFRDASTLWGMGSSFTVGRVIRERESHPGLRSIMRIGPAGEAMITYACVTTESYRHFGRLGLGAVFGSKKLKAIMVAGKRSLPVASPGAYRKIYDRVYQASAGSPAMKKYHDLGTAQNVVPLDQIGALPTRNLQRARFEGAQRIGGEALAEGYLGRRLACGHCPVACIHIAAIREPYVDEAYFYKTSMISYDYEPIFSLGSMLGIDQPMPLLQLMEWVEVLGLDAMSTGVVLAWATEALERGEITEAETLVPLRWGDHAAYVQAASKIVAQPNAFYRALGRGVEHAAAQYGGKEYALALGGNEMPGYHTGPATHAGTLVGGRHSHLDNAGYSLDQKRLARELLTPQQVAEALLEEEHWRQVLGSLVVCMFAREIYTPEIILEALRVLGRERDGDDLLRLGREIHRARYRFKLQEGFSFENLRIPRRLLETPSFVGHWDEAYVRAIIAAVQAAVT